MAQLKKNRFIDTLPTKVLDQVCDLYKEVYSAPPRFETIDTTPLRRSICRHLKDGWILTLSDNGRTIGMIGSTSIKMLDGWNDLGLKSTHRYLDNIMVKAEYRGRKLGKKLLEEFVAYHKNDDIYTRCRSDAKEINSLFELFGFQRITTYTSKFNGSVSNRHILELKAKETL